MKPNPRTRIKILRMEVFEKMAGFEANVTVIDSTSGPFKKYKIAVCKEAVFLDRVRQYLRYQQL